jgi:excisionase family DNA binding protein
MPSFDALLRQIVRDEVRDTVRAELLPLLNELRAQQPQPEASENDLLTAAQVAVECSVKRATVHEWIRTGRLEAMPLSSGGRTLRIRRHELRAFLRNGQKEGSVPSIDAEVERVLARHKPAAS